MREFVDKHTPGIYLRAALEQIKLDRPGLGWDEATRHTFASQWVIAGGSIEMLKESLGHYSVIMTERYAHLRPDLLPASDLGTIRVDLSGTDAEVVQLGLKTGSSLVRSRRNHSSSGQSGRSRPVSRVLSPRFLTSSEEANIHLRLALLRASSEQPGSAAGHRCYLRSRSPICPCTEWGLPCRWCHHQRGALLPHRFTLT